MKNLMLAIFTKLLLKVDSKIYLSLMFCFSAAVLSAFLDALTVTAVLIGVTIGFYRIYHTVSSGKDFGDISHNYNDNSSLNSVSLDDLEKFKAFLRDLVMHGAVGTALGGVCTIVGEPQNLLIAKVAGWEFIEFFLRMAPVTMPVFIAGLITCYCIERFRLAGFGSQLPESVRNVFNDFDTYERENTTVEQKNRTLY
jgi:NhaB family Na+:H+ antiporter